MTEDTAQDKKRKASGDNASTLRTENMTSGEILRAAREKRKLSLEDVSAAIHVRAVQLRAIEEGHIDALPGMTYAAGFVKSYASYLKLNPVELGNKFKSEHGALKPLMPDLPEARPIVESRMPDPRLVGIAAIAAVVVLLAWTFFADGDEQLDAISATATLTAEGRPDGAVEVAVDPSVSAPAVSAVETSGSPEDVAGEDAAEKPASEAKIEAKAEPKAAAEAVPAKEEAAIATADETAVKQDTVVVEEVSSATTGDAAGSAENMQVPTDESIEIRNAGRVIFKARQSTWIQVSDASERVVFKKLLRAGEQYTVPEGSGYTLNTTNAGGLDVIVDGQKAPSLGKPGEILRGVPVDPAELSRVKRARSRINN